MEAVARRKPRHVDELQEVTELRKWQIEVLGEPFVKALGGVVDDSPYKPG
jgi:ribonuclease D